MTWQLAVSLAVTIPALLITPFAIYYSLRRVEKKPHVYKAPGCSGRPNCMCYSCGIARQITKRTD